ncbi:TetR family transcriptional regulator, partial [Achromobacter ruhlandii]
MAKLQRDAVVAAALDLLNQVGVDGLTTRSVAERPGATPRAV